MKKSGLYTKVLSVAAASAMLFSMSAVTVGAASPAINTSTSVNAEIPFNGSSATLELGKSYILPSYISKLTGGVYDVKSSNNSVVKYKDGVITAVGKGTADIRITLRKGTVITKTITVAPPKAEITLDKTSLSTKVGSTETLKAILSKSTGKVTWSSSNNKIVSVDQNGKIKANKTGTAVITAKTSSGSTAKCTITVGDNNSNIQISVNKKSLILGVGETSVITASVTAGVNADKTVKWSSSNTKAATVAGGKITAKSTGTVTITATAANGKKSSCTVTVKKAPTKLTLSSSNIKLKVGQSYELKAVTDNGSSGSPVFSAAHNKICTVTQSGKITAKAVGTTKITVKTYNGKTAVCTVTVSK